MTYAEWGAICSGIVVAIALGGVLWRLANALGDAKALAKAANERAQAAALSNAAANLEIERVGRDLSQFREYVAREYASRGMLTDFKTEIMTGIGDLGRRIDQLFQARP